MLFLKFWYNGLQSHLKASTVGEVTVCVHQTQHSSRNVSFNSSNRHITCLERFQNLGSQSIVQNDMHRRRYALRLFAFFAPWSFAGLFVSIHGIKEFTTNSEELQFHELFFWAGKHHEMEGRIGVTSLLTCGLTH